ncbi:hypothetical protein [Hyalangium gracile]|uniref:hypothetical protein n=1 Tax=Hyalangium gracile TaxID=394092 RepID=UPI001CCB5C8F|nr:hypothetical protein [Hyalangium gracile]
MDLVPWNERLREDGAEPFRSCLVFGEKTGFSYYLGTVPTLANAHALQPVVYIDGHEAPFAIPVASSVDRFFDTYSRYLERMAVDLEYVHTGSPALLFPWSTPELVASDAPLIAQVRAGRFDFLAHGAPGALEWLEQLRHTLP